METWNVLPITGQPMFDYFFTLVMAFTTAAFFLGLLFRITDRS